jgi:hypothetical protein
MSQLVKTKRQANFKGFKRFGAFKGLAEQKIVVFNSFVCKLGLFWHSWAFKTLVLKIIKQNSQPHKTTEEKLENHTKYHNEITFLYN